MLKLHTTKNKFCQIKCNRVTDTLSDSLIIVPTRTCDEQV